MDWLGIGVLLIGVALLILVIVLIKPLSRLSNVLASVQKTTDDLPEKLTDVTGQAKTVLQTGNETIANVNDQVHQVSPVFHVVHDIGEASRELTSAALDKTMAFKQQTSDAKDFSQRKKYEGLYGLLSLIYYFSQKKDALKKTLPTSTTKES